MKTKEKVARKIKNMQGYVEFLKKQPADEEELVRNYLLKSAIERNLQLAISGHDLTPKNNLDNFDEYARYIARYLDKRD